MNYTSLPTWPKAYPETQASGRLKQENSDFVVTEIPLALPSGEGEHIWLYIEKNGANTAYVAQCLADFASVELMDVGYAGLKDRYAITQQWFSIYFPKGDTPDFLQLEHDEFKVLEQSRHVKKLRPGDLLGNRFQILLRNVEGEKEKIEANLSQVKAHGIPNYFGEQRFGREGDNVEQGRKMLAREIRVRNKKKKGIYLSAVRSFIFNEILAERIQKGIWGSHLEGELLDDQGIATGALWGRGRVATAGDTAELENKVAERHAILCEGLEHSGLNQDRRALAAIPGNLSWQWQENDQLMLSFSLSGGYYATSLIREFIQTEEPNRHDNATAVE